MIESNKKKLPWLTIVGVYSAILSVATVIGTVYCIFNRDEFPSNAIEMPFFAILLAMVSGATALSLFKRLNWGRYLFIASAPWVSIALASAFPNVLWKEDIPYTILAIIVYVPLCFVLGRGGVLRVVDAEDGSWRSRGGGLLLCCVIAMIAFLLLVMNKRPYGLVQWLVLCYVPLWNYLFAFIATFFPTRFEVNEGAQQSSSRNESSSRP